MKDVEEDEIAESGLEKPYWPHSFNPDVQMKGFGGRVCRLFNIISDRWPAT